ncbi:hypothetical protein [Bacillus wiedmannii]|uniref:hypothetical protein n=1 Tax=Bacillus wiedmannii TaxID=1890302 RepID=UPI000BEF3EC0|nr:hypothetical protein [Bacillus wiedmannii]PEO38475.1 hypothetical protein CN555_13060 [Bacillus wiedmannii]
MDSTKNENVTEKIKPYTTEKANVIADVKKKTSINEGTAIESQDFVELQLILKNGKWLVDNTKLIPKLKNE